jgi:hypothetical protein
LGSAETEEGLPSSSSNRIAKADDITKHDTAKAAEYNKIDGFLFFLSQDRNLNVSVPTNTTEISKL